MKYSYMLYQYLAATQTPCDGNFVYHGTLVGNHWSIEMQQAQRSFSSQSCVISALRPCGRLNRFFGRNQHCLLEVCNSIFLEKYFIWKCEQYVRFYTLLLLLKFWQERVANLENTFEFLAKILALTSNLIQKIN
jgi:hypothetical protein